MEDLRTMDSERGISQALVARVVMVVAAVVLLAAFFLPWGSAGEDFRQAAAQMPDVWFAEEAGITAADAADLSLLEYARAYLAIGQMGSGNAFVVLVPIIGSLAVLAALALLLAALGKPIGSAVFGVLTLAVSRLIVWDFTDRGVLPNATHEWGVAPTVYIVAAAVLVVAAVWMVVLKRRRMKTKA